MTTESGNHVSNNHTTSYKVEQNLFLGVCTILSEFVTVAINSVAAYYLLVFKKASRFNRKQYNNFLMGLQALMGTLLAVTGYSWTAVAHFMGEWPAGDVGCLLGTFCLLFFGTMTVMITLVMSAERFIAMCCPFYYEILIDFRKITVAVVYIFVHSAVLASLPLMLNTFELTKQPIAVCLYSLSSHSFKETVVVHAFVCNFSLSILLMLIMNVSVLKALKKMNSSVGMEIRAQFAHDRESIILSNLTGLMALSYSLCWLPIVVRVMLIYHAHWSSIYFDLLAFSLSTADPFVHPVTCLLVSQRYRAGYKAAMKDIISILGKRVCGCTCDSRVHAYPAHSSVSQTDSHSRSLHTLNHSLNSKISAGRNCIRLEVIVEAVENQD
ncbi:thromboxane A2 receptor-like [Oculina patagonica]